MKARTVVLTPLERGALAQVWNRINRYDEAEPFVEKRVDRVEVSGLTLTGMFSESAVVQGADIGLQGRMTVDFDVDREPVEGGGGRVEERVVMTVENRRATGPDATIGIERV